MRTNFNSVLLTKPIKSFPQNLIYNSQKSPDFYTMANEKGELVATMLASVKHKETSSVYKEFLPYKTLFIRSLNVRQPNKGYGKAFVEFAKQESYKKGCEGKVSLVAYNPSKSPHLFWYKQGFRSTKDFENDFFERSLALNLSLSYYDAIDMFLPRLLPEKTEHLRKSAPSLEKKPQGFREKIVNYIKKLF